MAESQLASLFIDFSVRGDKAADRAIDAKKSRLMQAAGAATAFGRSLAASAGSAVSQLGAIAQRALVVGSILKGALIMRGLQGTEEAETLSNAFTLLARVVADIFAPVIRGVTQALIELAGWIMNLDQGTKDSIVTWTLITGAVLGFAAALPAVKTGINLVTTAFQLLAAKIVLIPALILGVVAAVLYLTAEGDTFAERSASVLERVMKFWAALKAVLLSVWETVKAIGITMFRLFTGDFEGAWAAITSELADNWKKVWENASKEFSRAPATARDAVAAVQGMLSRITDIQGAAQSLANDSTPFGRILRAFTDRRPLQISAKVSTEFTSLEEVWKKMQKTLDESNARNDQDRQIQQLEEIRRNLTDLNRNGIRINNLDEIRVVV